MHPNMHRSEQRSVQRSRATKSERPKSGKARTERAPESAPAQTADDVAAPRLLRKCGLGDVRQFRSDLRTLARQFARTHSEKWTRNPRRARELAVRHFRKYLPQGRPGRPRSLDVTRAVLMRHQGRRWTEIYAVLFPDRDADRRRAKQSRLRAAVRFRTRYRSQNAPREY